MLPRSSGCCKTSCSALPLGTALLSPKDTGTCSEAASFVFRLESSKKKPATSTISFNELCERRSGG